MSPATQTIQQDTAQCQSQWQKKTPVHNFIYKCHKNGSLVSIDEKEFVVKSRLGFYYSFDMRAAVNYDGRDIESIEYMLRTGTGPIFLYAITRIVGYYSQVANWNKSKLGELEGRRAGNYSLPE